jgi:molybdate transport system substrate-binding protein
MSELHLLSGGAAFGLVSQLQGQFSANTGCRIVGTFNAVGAMRDQLLAGAACDVIILTKALIEQLQASGHVVAGSERQLGVVKTGVAVKTGETHPRVGTSDELKTTLLNAKGIYFPDPIKATAGIHFMNVLKQLGIDTQIAHCLRPFPNGATAMGEMAKCAETGLIGCTQVTEILYTAGVSLVAALPSAFELATIYTAALSTRADSPQAASALIELLASAQAASLRQAGGFEAA